MLVFLGMHSQGRASLRERLWKWQNSLKTKDSYHSYRDNDLLFLLCEATITKQKESYNKMLDEQLKQGVSVLEAQVKHQRDYLSAQAGQQKKQFDMQIEMEVKQQEMALQQQ